LPVLGFATWLAYSLRLEELNWPVDAQWWVYGLTPLLSIPIFVRFGLYRAIFRYTGQAALLATAKATVVYGASVANGVAVMGAVDRRSPQLGCTSALDIFPACRS
jgi:FlaA1/EpsC-like NDP-sugar epimerase